MDKCRLLYDLWVLFTEEHSDYEVRMTAIDGKDSSPETAELIESVEDGASWQKDMDFLELCRIPFGCAVSEHHPLAQEAVFTPDMLEGQTVVVFERSPSQDLQTMCRQLEEKKIRVIRSGAFLPSTIWDSSYYHRILLVPLVWQDILFDVTIKPCRWDYTIPYGIFSRKDLSSSAKDFLNYIRDVYSPGSTRKIIPVF